MKDCIEQNWDWRKNYHFLKISFGSGVTQTREDLLVTLQEILDDLERENGLKCTNQSIHGKFTERIKTLSRKTNQKVVVLLDEYDKPILDAIENREIAKQIRDELKNFYSVLKDLDEFLKFVFITGVSKFSKVSLFSGLNHLQDISLNPKYAIICGYTHNELVTTFENQLKETNLEAIQSWYNGYNFLGESVYNPFDVLLYFAQRQLHPYWFETGTPNFLLKIFLEKNFHIANLEELIAFEDLIDTLDVDLIEPENLLFQTGYLTIRSYEEIPTGYLYHLTYPNKEVKVSLNRYFCNFLTQLSSETARQTNELYKAIKKAEISKLYDILKTLFVSIPYEWHRKNEIANYEGYYASVVYSFFAGAGFEMIAEDYTSRGRIDLSLFYEEKCFMIEFKVVEQEQKTNKALATIKQKEYHLKYSTKVKEIYLIGIDFSKESKSILNFEWEKIV